MPDTPSHHQQTEPIEGRGGRIRHRDDRRQLFGLSISPGPDVFMPARLTLVPVPGEIAVRAQSARPHRHRGRHARRSRAADERRRQAARWRWAAICAANPRPVDRLRSAMFSFSPTRAARKPRQPRSLMTKLAARASPRRPLHGLPRRLRVLEIVPYLLRLRSWQPCVRLNGKFFGRRSICLNETCLVVRWTSASFERSQGVILEGLDFQIVEPRTARSARGLQSRIARHLLRLEHPVMDAKFPRQSGAAARRRPAQGGVSAPLKTTSRTIARAAFTPAPTNTSEVLFDRTSCGDVSRRLACVYCRSGGLNGPRRNVQ